MNRRGSLFIVVLWSLSLLTATSIALGVGIRQKLTLLNRLSTSDALEAGALAGVEKGKGLVKEDLEDDFDGWVDAWATSSREFESIKLARVTVTVSYPMRVHEKDTPHYGVMDESSKLGLNQATAVELDALLQAAGGLEADEAQEIAMCIIDWRDGDSTYGHPNYGAEDTDYDDLKQPYEAKDAPFQTVYELLLIKGINRGLFDKIKDLVTPFGTGRVNVNTADRRVLQALGLSEDAAEKIHTFRLGADKKPGTEDDGLFKNAQTVATTLEQAGETLVGADQTAVSNLIAAEKIGIASTVFMARSVARFADGGAWVMAETVFDRKGKMFYSKTTGVHWPSRQ